VKGDEFVLLKRFRDFWSSSVNLVALTVSICVLLLLVPVPALASISLTGINPSSGTLGETVEVTLTGTGFSSETAAKINRSTGALIVNGSLVGVPSDTSALFRFTIPANAPTGEQRLTVTRATYEAARPFHIASAISALYFDDDNVLGSSLYLSANNTIEIAVQTSSGNAEVQFGSVVTIKADGSIVTSHTGLGPGTEKSGSTYTVARYPLRAGNNSIAITASVGGRRETLRFTVTYPDVPSAGAEYYVGDITKASKIDAFGKAVALDLGRGNYLTDGGGAFSPDQFLIITARGSPDQPPGGFVGVSPVYQLESAATADRIGRPVRLALRYSGLGASPDNLTIWKASNQNFTSGLENLGGVVDSRAGTITVSLDGSLSGHYAVFVSIVGAETFADLPLDGWYYHAVSALRAKGVMEPATAAWGYPNPGDNNFGLSLAFQMCRGEFAFMMVRALGLPLLDVTGSSFIDVSAGRLGGNALYVRAVETAAHNGLIRGFPDGRFYPKADEAGAAGILTREQAAAIMARAAGLRLNTLETSVNAALRKLYSDWESIPVWARSSVLACHQAGLMGGLPNADGTFRFYDHPANNRLTRAQAASLVHRFMEHKKLL